MHILGSARALDVLDAEGDTSYGNYARKAGELRELFGGFDSGDWHQNLDRQGNPIPVVLKNLAVKDPFHLPRALIYCIDVCDRLARQA